MKYILSIVFVFVSLLAYAQQDTVFVRYSIPSYKTDTILFDEDTFIKERDMLIGKNFLPWTEKQCRAYAYGLIIDHVTLEPCEEVKRLEENKITSVVETVYGMDVSIKILNRYCSSFFCDVDVINGKTINLIADVYGCPIAGIRWESICGITFHFIVLEYYPHGRKTRYPKLKNIIINGQKNTRHKIR